VIAPVERDAPQQIYPSYDRAKARKDCIHKPIELNFANFPVKLNGIPQKICVNPENVAIEIDL